MEDKLREKIEEIFNQSNQIGKRVNIEDIVRKIFKDDNKFEISIKSIDEKNLELRIVGMKIAVMNGLANLLDKMIKKNYINFEDLDIIYKILKEENN